MHKTHLHQDPWPLRGRKRNLVHEMGNMPERKIRRYKTNYYIVAAKRFFGYLNFSSSPATSKIVLRTHFSMGRVCGPEMEYL